MIYTSSIYICTASAQNAELKVMGVFEVRIWSGAGVSVLVCTRGSAFGGGLVCFSRNKRSKQARVPTFVWLFRDVATTAKGPGCDEGTKLR